MTAGPAAVVCLVARADLEQAPGGGTSATIRESALLSDGREVTLLEDRGWTTSGPLGEISLTHVVRSVDTAVLPDDAEVTGERHEWQRFARRLREVGIAVTPEQLRVLPYRVLVSVPGGPERWWLG